MTSSSADATGPGPTPPGRRTPRPTRRQREGLAAQVDRWLGGGSRGYLARNVVTELGDIDRAIYAAVAEVPTPTLDAALRRLSMAADHGMIWFATAGITALVGGPRGRRAALDGVIAIGITSFVVNVPLKALLPRSRPDRELHGVLTDRRVPLPRSASFPSGHSASSFAFANALGGELPWVALPVRFAAAAVAWSRIHTGVHYPGDVMAGALVGGSIGEVVGTVRRRIDDRVTDPGGAIRGRTAARTPGC